MALFMARCDLKALPPPKTAKGDRLLFSLNIVFQVCKFSGTMCNRKAKHCTIAAFYWTILRLDVVFLFHSCLGPTVQYKFVFPCVYCNCTCIVTDFIEISVFYKEF